LDTLAGRRPIICVLAGWDPKVLKVFIFGGPLFEHLGRIAPCRRFYWAMADKRGRAR
jgi:hypothetical protein